MLPDTPSAAAHGTLVGLFQNQTQVPFYQRGFKNSKIGDQSKLLMTVSTAIQIVVHSAEVVHFTHTTCFTLMPTRSQRVLHISEMCWQANMIELLHQLDPTYATRQNVGLSPYTCPC